jgi:UDP-3-O-[3-hydroxymyristoyl] glucosamine N-acyltransferase
MSDPIFFARLAALTAREIADMTAGHVRGEIPAQLRVTNIAALDRAGPHDLAFFDDAAQADAAAATRAGVCLTTEALAPKVRPGVVAVRCAEPYAAFIAVAQHLFGEAARPSSLVENSGIAGASHVHATARLESDVTVDPGAIIGPRAEIGAGTTIGAAAVVGAGVRIGRGCTIGAGAVLSHALLGDRVGLRPGSRIGQDGIEPALPEGKGFPGPGGKVPAVGRVIIQDGVEIGAGAVIDRGTLGDTLIGEGSRIGDLVVIGRDCSIGRHCTVLSQAGLAGGATLEDHVVLGARVGIDRSVTIGEGARIAAFTVVGADVPPGGTSEIRR